MINTAKTYAAAIVLADMQKRLWPGFSVTIERPLFRGDHYRVIVS